MSGSVEDYDGLCGIPHEGSNSNLQLKCKYEMGHAGQHSWSKIRLRGEFFHTGCAQLIIKEEIK